MSRLKIIGLAAALAPVVISVGCVVTPMEPSLQHPLIDEVEVDGEDASCRMIDYRLRQADSIRWSLRQDGAELETDFAQFVQLSAATAASVTIVALLLAVYPDPTLALLPFAGAYTDADRLKRTDALLIALLAKRAELACPAHSECAFSAGFGGSLYELKALARLEEEERITEEAALKQITTILDGLCPSSQRFLRREPEDKETAFEYPEKNI